MQGADWGRNNQVKDAAGLEKGARRWLFDWPEIFDAAERRISLCNADEMGTYKTACWKELPHLKVRAYQGGEYMGKKAPCAIAEEALFTEEIRLANMGTGF